MECLITFAGIPGIIKGDDTQPVLMVSPGGGCHATKHIAAFSAPARFVGPASDEADASVEADFGQLLIWNLAGCVVRFWPDGRPPKTRLKYTVKNIPVIEEIVPMTGRFDARLLSKIGAEQTISAVTMLETGTLRDGHVDPKISWRFKDGNGDILEKDGKEIRQLIADNTEYSLKVNHYLLVDILNVERKQRRRVLLQRPNQAQQALFASFTTRAGVKKAAASPALEACISSLPSVTEDLGEGAEMPHFASQYDFLMGPPSPRKRYIPFIEVPGAGEGYRCRSSAVVRVSQGVEPMAALGHADRADTEHHHG